MIPGALAETLLFGASLAVAASGVALLFGAENLVKRLVGLAIAEIGAALALAALGGAALQSLTLVLLAALAAQLMLGAAVAVRAAEHYGGVEMDALVSEDAKDEESEA
jgi:multisubunit Na+/H+ antiporter MnhC subunit